MGDCFAACPAEGNRHFPSTQAASRRNNMEDTSLPKETVSGSGAPLRAESFAGTKASMESDIRHQKPAVHEYLVLNLASWDPKPKIGTTASILA